MTDRTLQLRPLAQADIDAILAYLCAEGGPRLAGKFAQLLEDALRALATHPAIGSRLSALRGPAGIPGLRSWPIKQSAYLIVMDEQHSLTAASYVERNPLRARLCARPQDWP
jgi:plasmid stabilization system protein ParE